MRSISPPSHTAIASAWPMPASTPTSARSPPVRLNPSVATAITGNAIAGSCVDGSIDRSGRTTLHPHAAVAARRISAATPGVVSVRSVQVVGLSAAPTERPVSCTVRNTTVSTTPRSAAAHAHRRKRTVRTYSMPSGHAIAISTSEPRRAASPSEPRRRASPSGPPTLGCVASEPVAVPEGSGVVEVAAPATVVPAAGSTVAAGSSAVAPVAPVAPVAGRSGRSGRGAGAGVVGAPAGGSLSTVNPNVADPFGVPSGAATRYVTLHEPFGSALTTGTVSVSKSGLTAGFPIGTCVPLHVATTVFFAPTCAANVRVIDVGDASTLLPSAGLEPTSSFSACAVSTPTNVDPRTPANTSVASAAAAQARGSGREERTAGPMVVRQR